MFRNLEMIPNGNVWSETLAPSRSKWLLKIFQRFRNSETISKNLCRLERPLDSAEVRVLVEKLQLVYFTRMTKNKKIPGVGKLCSNPATLTEQKTDDELEVDPRCENVNKKVTLSRVEPG